tara:strand:+ start:1501 stop:2070 length:570 start_codon:yes stop_codon:yes gene_type:complete
LFSNLEFIKKFHLNKLALQAINFKKNKMRFIWLSLIVIFSACTQTDDMALYKTNLEVAQKAMSCFETPQDFETYKSLIHQDVQHQSPVYGKGIVGYEDVMNQAKFYMEGFSDVTFANAVWLPGVDTASLQNNGSVRVYGTWQGKSNENGKSFAVDSYHYFDVTDGKITASGDYFDASGMVMAVSESSEE